MLATVNIIIKYLEELAPLYLAAEWDNTGLQIGNPEDQVSTVLVALDLEQQVLAEALRRQAQLVITHHPLWLKPPARIDESQPQGSLIASIIRNKVNVYSAHTNLDIALLNGILADLAGINQTGREVIEVTSGKKWLKLVVFVPKGHEEKVRQAVAEAGAGWVGRYSHCTFQV
ncbi:MAG TPA: Nif3-like dinuclear metal center hexameric protein, partial [Firmicutes bacterium]|nr:Nif3-like dinuclear metal center hexameric protein [Bacillota bacterium]